MGDERYNNSDKLMTKKYFDVGYINGTINKCSLSTIPFMAYAHLYHKPYANDFGEAIAKGAQSGVY